jgi:1-acyl-sn-glycerol-3-phosphate acyltransferase
MALPENLTQKLCFHGSFWPVYFALTLGLSFRASGRNNIPGSGPALLVANHQSFLDPWLIGNASTRWLVYLARHNLFKNPIFSLAIRSYGAVPIDRGFGKEGLVTVLNLLDKGRAVVVFAEGERTHDGTLQPFKPGISLLIKKANCPIIPVGLAGCYDFWPRQAKLPSPELIVGPAEKRSIGLHFGEAVHSTTYHKLPREVMLDDLSQRVAQSISVAERLRRKPKPVESVS